MSDHWERELLLNELRQIVHVADDSDVSDWQRGYRACADVVTRWVGQRVQLARPNQIMVLQGGGPVVVDYRDLLLRYMDHVSREEGTDFLVDWKRPPGRFTDEEWAELRTLAWVDMSDDARPVVKS